MSNWDRSPSRAPGLGQSSSEEEDLDSELKLSDRRRSVAMQRRWVQRKANGPEGGGGRIPQSLGQPLGTDVRRGMERHLGADISHARVHTGPDSAAAAEQFGARAFTVGNDVHFGAGEFAPGSQEGDRLLAHELTHVVQGQRTGVQRKPKPEGEGGGGGEEKEQEGDEAAGGEAVSQPEDPAEKEADAAGDHVAEKMHGKGEKGGKGKDKKGKGKGESKEGKEEEGKEEEGEGKEAEGKGGEGGGEGGEGKGDKGGEGGGKGGDAKEAAPPIAAKLVDGAPKVFLAPKPNKAAPPGGKPAPGKPAPGGATPAGNSPQEAELQLQLDSLAEMEKNPAAAKPEQLGMAKERIAEITMQPALQRNPKAELAKTRVQAVQDKVDAYYVERIQELIIAPLAAAKSDAQLGKVQSVIATMQRQNLDPLLLAKAVAALADGQKQLLTARHRIAAEQQKAKDPTAGAATPAAPSAAGAQAGKPAAAGAQPPAAAKAVNLAVDEGHKPDQPPHAQPPQEPAAHDHASGDAKGDNAGVAPAAEHAEAMKKYQKFVEYIKGVGVVDPSMPRIVKLMLETDLGPFKALIPAEYAQAEQLVHQRIAEFVQHRNSTAAELLQKIEALSADEAGTDMNTELKHYRQQVDTLLECDTEGRDKLKNQLDEALNKKAEEHRESEEKKKESGGDAEGAAPAKPEKGRVGKFLDDRKEKKQEKKQAKVIAKGEVDGDIALVLLKECFGASKKAMEKGEVKLVSTDALRSVVGEADFDRITESGKKTVFGLNQDGVNYINSEALVGEHKDKGLTVLVHEMLHQNTAAGFKEGCGTLGLNEGVTEWLTRQVVEQKQLVPHNLYDGQLMVVQELLNSGLSASFLKDCYFNSGKAVLSGWISKHCQGSFEKIDQALADGNSAKAIAYAGRK